MSLSIEKDFGVTGLLNSKLAFLNKQLDFEKSRIKSTVPQIQRVKFFLVLKNEHFELDHPVTTDYVPACSVQNTS